MLERRLQRDDPLWPAQLAVGLAIALNFGLSDKVVVGPAWVLPSVEGGLLLSLVLASRTRSVLNAARHRQLGLAVVGFVSLANMISLGLLVDHLVNSHEQHAYRLIESGALLWCTNVLIFAVWYWEMDRADPRDEPRPQGVPADFRFPRQDLPDDEGKNWRPGFGDYLYVSFTNATAFSPTDTMPLTLSAKGVMAMQSIAALLTLALVVARAVNILGT
jgi:uncharacterized membrane protein